VRFDVSIAKHLRHLRANITPKQTMLIKAIQKDDVLLNDIKTSETGNGFKIWWLAQSGFLIKWQGKFLLFDPYLSDSLSVKYASTDKPHTRMSELVIDPARLDMVDIVTSSHNHTDHLDGETLIPLLSVNYSIKFIIPEANRGFVCERVKCKNDFPIGLSDGESVEVNGFKIYGVPAAHNTIERDGNGKLKFMGFVVEFGGYKVYHSGDTLWYDGIVETLKPFQVDVAFLPINGNKPERRVAGNLNYKEAVQLAKQINARLTIPHHYHLFDFNTENPQIFIQEAVKEGIVFKVLGIGEGVMIGDYFL
jgi:L-ascorbate metabolism protein UlaG (beta-lactamase superfamily)